MSSEDENRLKRTETQGIEKVSVNPDYLAKYVEEDKSLDALKEHRVVPRFKIVQPTTEEQLKTNFGEGSVIIRPGDALVSKYKAAPEYFDFVPLFFFMEWAKWRDLRGTGPMILDRSHDASSELAALSKNAETRKELYSGHEALDEKERMYNQYVEHIRFIGTIYGEHPLVGTPVTLSFERGEWGQGKNFISAVSLRRQVIKAPTEYETTDDGDEIPVGGQSRPVPLWAQVWRLSTVYHNPDQLRKWYGFHFEAAPQEIILPGEADSFHALHKEFGDLFEAQRLTVQDEEANDEQTDAVKAHEDF